jgi:hypothetical protein
MQFKTTQKAIMNGYSNVIGIPYCALQNLLSCESEIAYTARAEGWRADIYDFGNTAIATGYAPFGNIRPGYDICRKYEHAAEKVCCNHDLSWAERKADLQTLIREFIEEVTQ